MSWLGVLFNQSWSPAHGERPVDIVQLRLGELLLQRKGVDIFSGTASIHDGSVLSDLPRSLQREGFRK